MGNRRREKKWMLQNWQFWWIPIMFWTYLKKYNVYVYVYVQINTDKYVENKINLKYNIFIIHGKVKNNNTGHVQSLICL